MKGKIVILWVSLWGFLGLHGEGEVKSFTVRGVVRELRPKEKEIVIKHEAIPGYMDAMVMPFEVRDQGLFERVVPGDTVTFTLRVTEKADWVEGMRVESHGPGVSPVDALVPKVKVGSVLDFNGITLTDQGGRKFELSGTRGRPVVLTFFLTRCPFPTMCPLLATKFEEAQKLLGEDGDTRTLLVSVSIDPQNDQPGVLAKYGQAHNVDPVRWKLLTGDLRQITKVALLCGASFWDSQGMVTHSLRTLVIAPNGTVKQIYSDNEWSPKKLVRAVQSSSR